MHILLLLSMDPSDREDDLALRKDVFTEVNALVISERLKADAHLTHRVIAMQHAQVLVRDHKLELLGKQFTQSLDFPWTQCLVPYGVERPLLDGTLHALFAQHGADIRICTAIRVRGLEAIRVEEVDPQLAASLEPQVLLGGARGGLELDRRWQLGPSTTRTHRLEDGRELVAFLF